ncbi:hypothetical protein [Kribbella sp. NPDC023855]|uniref:hypothetical protein n=1 Tax=Kribbella sp. NPDC023855 TaxID=3154698 RepID=UPI00340E0312
MAAVIAGAKAARAEALGVVGTGAEAAKALGVVGTGAEAAKALGVVGTGAVGAASVLVTVGAWGTGELWGTGLGGIEGRLSGWLGGLGRCHGRWG